MIVLAYVVVVLAVWQPSVTAYSMSFGRCAKVEEVKNFAADQFSGVWYVVETFSASGKCLTLTFERKGTSGDFKVTEGREYVAAQVVGIDHAFTTSGEFQSKAPSHPAKFNARWSNNLLGASEATLVDTDYWQYAVIVECQPVMYFIKKTSAVILSRKRSLDLRVLGQLKRALADKYGLDTDDFEAVDHNRCRSTPQEVKQVTETEEELSDIQKPSRKFRLPPPDMTVPPTPPPTEFPLTAKPTQARPKPKVTTRSPFKPYGKLQLWCDDLGLC